MGASLAVFPVQKKQAKNPDLYFPNCKSDKIVTCGKWDLEADLVIDF